MRSLVLYTPFVLGDDTIYVTYDSDIAWSAVDASSFSMTYYTNNLNLPNMSFLLLLTRDISDPFYQSRVEILESDDTSFLVKHIGTKE